MCLRSEWKLYVAVHLQMTYKVSSEIVKASKTLCRSILEAAGGSSAVANSLDWDRRYIHKYMKIGYMPLERVYEIADLLSVSPWALAYFKLLETVGPDYAPTFKDVVHKTALVPPEKNRILALIK